MSGVIRSRPGGAIGMVSAILALAVLGAGPAQAQAGAPTRTQISVVPSCDVMTRTLVVSFIATDTDLFPVTLSASVTLNGRTQTVTFRPETLRAGMTGTGSIRVPGPNADGSYEDTVTPAGTDPPAGRRARTASGPLHLGPCPPAFPVPPRLPAAGAPDAVPPSPLTSRIDETPDNTTTTMADAPEDTGDPAAIASGATTAVDQDVTAMPVAALDGDSDGSAAALVGAAGVVLLAAAAAGAVLVRRRNARIPYDDDFDQRWN